MLPARREDAVHLLISKKQEPAGFSYFLSFLPKENIKATNHDSSFDVKNIKIKASSAPQLTLIISTTEYLLKKAISLFSFF